MSLRTVRNMIHASISLEDDGSPAVEINVHVSKDAAAADAAAADVSQAQDDLDEQSDDVEDQQEASDQVEESAANLEAIAIALESAIKEGVVNSQSLHFANLAINNEHRRLGLPEHKVSLESMGTASGRIAQTRISLEDVKETMTKAWEAIKKFFIEIYNRVVEFFVGLFSKVAKLKRYGERLLVVAKTQLNLPVGKRELVFKDGNFLTHGINTPVKATNTVVENIPHMETFIDTIVTASEAVNFSKVGDVITGVEHFIYEETKFKTTDDMDNHKTKEENFVNIVVSSGLFNQEHIDKLVGDQSVKMVIATIGTNLFAEKIDRALRAVPRKFITALLRHEANSPYPEIKKTEVKIAPLSGREQVAALTSLLAIVGKMTSLEGATKKLTNGIKETRDKIVNSLAKAADANFLQKKLLSMVLGKVVSWISNMILSINKALFTEVALLMRYVDMSQKALHKKEA